MEIIYALDKNNGYLFNNFRQTYDLAVIKDIVERVNTQGSTLWLSPYTKKLFEGFDVRVNLLLSESNDFQDSDIVFIEDQSIDYEGIVDKPLTFRFYKWDKVYPSNQKIDVYADFCGKPFINQFEIVEVYSLIGETHHNIYVEKWEKNNG